jgi:hypothetical protein
MIKKKNATQYQTEDLLFIELLSINKVIQVHAVVPNNEIYDKILL